MRKFIFTLLIVVFVLPLNACSKSEPKADNEKALYAIGVMMSKQMEILSLKPEELDFVKKGMTDSLTGKKLIVNPEAYQQKVSEFAQARMKLSAEKQKEKSKAYLESAAREKGAQKTDSGLVYIPIKEGTGQQPKETDMVRVHYQGALIDGKVFDSSIKRGQPVDFPLNRVIKCWGEGITKMKVGGKAKVVCPASLAYGDSGRPPVIPAGAALVFEVELLDIVNPADANVQKK
ncbi:MAG: FKBP-type peptidyl-prolyl cis-trans isomerase [Deltaproteobacteria bacterium]|nr:FKBP-type peptidyl-prolyl cis-trans isomerase [Deltaproteobacteria bacterium]